MKSPRKFHAAQNPDSDGLYVEALHAAGYLEVERPTEADFIIHDAVHPKIRDFLLKHPNVPSFITPHTPQSYFIWDGIQPQYPTLCNFVAGPAAVKGMKAYGYKYRVEAVGFNRCKVREFTPTRGSDLLIVPAHPNAKGRYAQPNYLNYVYPVFDMVLWNRQRFGKVAICWSEVDRMDARWKERMMRAGIRFINANPFTDDSPLLHMMERIEAADLILACGTAGCVSVAMGKPTVFFSEVGVPYSPPRPAQNSHLYLRDLRFPLTAETMTIDEILDVRCAPNEKAEKWKRGNIGGDFNAEKFISIVREYFK